MPPEKSIAVLPLENLSEDKENAFFADGIQDDVLTSLTKISDLKVISRTSVMQYRGAGAARNLREIARALGVANVLEGSVRRIDNRVVVNVQLIDARTDRHDLGGALRSHDRRFAWVAGRTRHRDRQSSEGKTRSGRKGESRNETDEQS